MKSLLLKSSLLVIPCLFTSSIVSCSQPSDYKKMAFVIDENKVKEQAKDINSFNKRAIDIEKLKLVLVQENNDSIYIDKYTKQAMDIKLFTEIKIIDDNKNWKLDIKITDVDPGNKQKKYSYRLPNGSLNQTWIIKK